MQRPLGWYLKRVRSMRPREIAHRVRELVTIRRLAAAYRRAPDDAAPAADWRRLAFCTSEDRCLPELSWRTPSSGARARILDGHWAALGYPWRWRDHDEVWQEAPDTGRIWPRTFFGAIPYLAGNPVGDVRVAWEPARLQQLIALALIAREDEEPDALQAITVLEDQLLSWVAANPPLSGIHYISVMECAQRILAACHALDMVRDRLTRPERVWPALMRLVQGHAPLIEQRMSLHSSTGNHTVTEAAGLIYAGTLFAELPDASRWRGLGCAVLEREAARQVLPDGGGSEQAFRYLLLVVDLLGLVVALMRHRGETPPPAIAAAFGRGRRFLGAFATGAEDLPAIGDSDSGYALSRYLNISWADPGPAAGTETFGDAGYTLVTARRAERPLRVVFDHGPFGMPPLYGHGHADALSLTLRLGTEDVLIDPGTYSYTGHPEWRRYFRSTRAHNTVTVDGRDQARQELSFMWSQAHAAELVRRATLGEDGLLALARHGGYRGLGITHWRGVAFMAPEWLLVIDQLSGTGRHDLELNWHSGLRATQDGSLVALTGAATRVQLRISGGRVSVHRAEELPPRGWHAPVYGVREPADTVAASWSGDLPHRFVSVIGLGEGAPDDDAARHGLRALEGWMEGI